MIEEIKANVNLEIEMLRELSNYYRRLSFSSANEAKLLLGAIDSLRVRMKLLNNSLPGILTNISLAKPLSKKKVQANLERIHFYGPESELKIVLNSKDKELFIAQLRINEQILKKLRKNKIIEVEADKEFKASRGYLKMANKLFLNRAQSLTAKGHFKSLALQLKKANIDILFESYIAMLLFTTTLAFVLSVIIAAFFLVFNINLSFDASIPIISLYEGEILNRLIKLILIPVLLPFTTFAVIYYYPSTEKEALKKRIDQEIPFAVIHMSAISGAGVEPSEIFKIISTSKEYPFLKKEIRKVVNQINLYGYDLVTALNNVTRATSSTKLAELLSGLSTTITSGGSLQNFFEKRAETLLLSYRLEREKYIKVAETFMDIYISVVIAAPMILLILLIMISVSNINMGFTRDQMTFGIILIISLINILFLAFLHMKQPSY